MSYLIILALAVVQGAAELLPVSSSAHVILMARLLGLETAATDFHFLLVMLHTGTMFAVLVYFWPRWRWLLLASENSSAAANRLPGDGLASRRSYWLMLILATACTAGVFLVLKLVLEKVVLERLMGGSNAEVEELFKNLYLIAAALGAVGILIIVAGHRQVKRQTDTVGVATAVWIGLVQGLCIPFRGFSRSGATISTALWRGVERRTAEEFSFALAVILTPPAIGRELFRLLRDWPSGKHLADLLLPGLVGMMFSFAAGLVALRVLSRVLDVGRWQVFGYYCLAAAAVMLSAAVAGY
jgi:undecaprenyl-diphosphatase